MTAIPPARTRRPTPGFTLIELLVVIALVVLLVGLLLPALGYVNKKARYSQVVAQLGSIGQACESYYSTFKAYPGLFADTGTNISIISPPALPAGSAWSNFTSSANLSVSLLGGLQAYSGGCADPSTYYNVNVNNGYSQPNPNGINWTFHPVGAGPVVGNHVYAPFYNPKANELNSSPSPATATWTVLADQAVGLPILYYRAQPAPPTNQPVAESWSALNPTAYIRKVNSAYTDNALTAISGKTFDQTTGSLLGPNQLNNLAGVVDNQSQSDPTNPNTPAVFDATTGKQTGGSQAGGGFALIAANQDGFYLSKFAANQAGVPTDMLTRNGWSAYAKMMAPVYVGGRAP
jgi:prepilin-type N-terminal cleavage/methylation domain-containing protein